MSSFGTHFVAQITQVFFIINGEHIKAAYTPQDFVGKTQTTAIMKAHDAIRGWLKRQYPSVQTTLLSCEASSR